MEPAGGDFARASRSGRPDRPSGGGKMVSETALGSAEGQKWSKTPVLQVFPPPPFGAGCSLRPAGRSLREMGSHPICGGVFPPAGRKHSQKARFHPILAQSGRGQALLRQGTARSDRRMNDFPRRTDENLHARTVSTQVLVVSTDVRTVFADVGTVPATHERFPRAYGWFSPTRESFQPTPGRGKPGCGRLKPTREGAAHMRKPLTRGRRRASRRRERFGHGPDPARRKQPPAAPAQAPARREQATAAQAPRAGKRRRE
jgi:hypothetical protein